MSNSYTWIMPSIKMFIYCSLHLFIVIVSTFTVPSTVSITKIIYSVVVVSSMCVFIIVARFVCVISLKTHLDSNCMERIWQEWWVTWELTSQVTTNCNGCNLGRGYNHCRISGLAEDCCTWYDERATSYNKSKLSSSPPFGIRYNKTKTRNCK